MGRLEGSTSSLGRAGQHAQRYVDERSPRALLHRLLILKKCLVQGRTPWPATRNQAGDGLLDETDSWQRDRTEESVRGGTLPLTGRSLISVGRFSRLNVPNCGEDFMALVEQWCGLVPAFT